MGLEMSAGENKRKPQRENKLNEICMSMSDNLVNFFKLPIQSSDAFVVALTLTQKVKPIYANFSPCLHIHQARSRQIF